MILKFIIFLIPGQYIITIEEYESIYVGHFGEK